MKVLQITNNYPTTKFPILGIFVKEQINSLSNMGIDNTIFQINGREKGKIEYLKVIPKLRKLLSQNKYDVIHCHHVLSALTLILALKSRKNNVILSFQSDPSNENGIWLFNFVRKYVKAVIIKNNSRLIDNKLIYHLPNGVNIDFFRPISKNAACEKLNLDKTKIYILFLSSNFLRPEKRYDIFKDVLKILEEKYKIENVEELKLINTERELVPYYFNLAAVHLLTSDFEGSPNSVKEAMACNTSVVSTNVGNVSELLNNVNGSFVSKTNNPEELAKLVFDALNYKGGTNSRNKIIEMKLDIDSVANKLIKIYETVLNKK